MREGFWRDDRRARALRQQRQRDSDEAVQPEFFQHAGMEHRRGGRRRTVAERRPGVKRPERDEDSEAEQKQREDEALRPVGHRIGFEVIGDFAVVERAPVRRQLQVKRNQAD